MGKSKLNNKLMKSGLALSAMAVLSGASLNAATVTFDGNGTSSITLETAANWDTNTLPTTSDRATFTNAGFGGALPASLTNGAAQTWGNLTWNSNSSSTLSGTALTLSGGAGTSDVITLGSQMTSGTLTYAFSTNSTFISPATANINVVNAGATLIFQTQFEFNNSVTNQVITKTGAGTMTFTNGNNGSNGAGTGSKFVLDGGTLNFAQNNGNMFGGSTATVFEIHGGTSIDTNGAGFDLTSARNYAQTWAGDFTYKGTTGKSLNLGTGAVTLTGGSRQVTTTGGALTIGGVIGDAGNVYGLTKAGANTLVLTGASTYTGATTVNAGTLDLGGSGANGSISSSSGLAMGGGTFKYSKTGTNTQTFNGLTVNSGASTINASSVTNTIALGAITRNAGGTVNFTNAGTNTTTTGNNSAGILGGYATYNNADWAVVTGGAIGALGTYTALTGVGDTTATNNDVITGNVTLTGAVAINSLKLNGNNAVLANGTNAVTVGGAGSGGLLVTQNATITGTGIVGAGATNEFIVYNPSFLGISGRIIGNATSGGLTKAGGGLLRLSGSNNYTGATTVNAGTLEAGSTTGLSASSAVTIGTGGTLALNTFSNTIGSLASNNASGGGLGAVTLGTGTLTTGGLNTNTTFNGVISSGAGGALVKTGTGTQTLTGASTYTGGTTVSGGGLKINNLTGSATGAGTVLIQSTATLSGGNGAAFNGAVDTLGAATKTNYAASVVGIISGATTIASGGHLAPGNSVGTLTLATLDLNSGSVLDYEFNLASNDLTTITGSGGLTFGSVGLNLYQEGGTTQFAAAGLYNIFDYNTSFTGTLANLSVLNPNAGYSYTFVNDTTNTLIQLQVVAVPEPSTYALLGMGLSALWVLRRKKKV